LTYCTESIHEPLFLYQSTEIAEKNLCGRTLSRNDEIASFAKALFLCYHDDMSQIGLTFLFLCIAALLLLSNILRADIVALMLMLALGLSGILTSQEAFSGFSRSAVIVMLSAFILAEGLHRSGLTERLGSFIIRLFGKGERRLIFGVMTASAVLSLFMNNIAAASLLFPSLSGVARRSKVSPSKLLMPLAFGTILGGMATLLTTTNIIVSGLLRDAKLPGFTLTDFAPIGLPLVFAGILFMVFWGRKLLPDQSPAQRHEESDESDDLLNTYQLAERLVKAEVRKGGSLDGVTLGKSDLREKYHLNVIAIQRGKSTLPVEAKTILKSADILLIMARPEDSLPATLLDMMTILPSGEWQQDYLSMPDMKLIEAAIAPRSHLAHQTLQEIRFGQKFGARVLAVWRRGRSIRTRLADLPLEFGDGLLLQGAEKSLALLRTEPGLILLAESAPSTRMTLRGWFTTLIMAVTLVSAVIFSDNIAEIMLSGAVAMVLIRTLSMDQAYRAIDWRSLFLVAGMLPVGVALNKTGASTLFANSILSSLGGAGHLALLAGFVLLTVALTQVINGAAAVTVIAPVAIIAAQQVGMEPRSLAMAVALASSMAFMSPLGHAVNVMVMGAGGYTFKDYARVGIPLTILLVAILLIILPLIMPIG
jgi:di/tricarboxylate transporter